MAVLLLKRVTCDMCGKASSVSELTDYYDRSVPKGWAKLSYELEDHNGLKYTHVTLDICDCCLEKEDTKVMFYPAKMIKEGNHARD